MPETITPEALLSNIMETLTDNSPKQRSGSLADDITESVQSQVNGFFGRQKPLHKMLGGGKSADVLLWRNKKISASVLGFATGVWVVFEWLNYHFLTILCFILVLGMGVQFAWSNASGFLSRSSSEVPRIVLPEDIFVKIAIALGAELNKALGFLQDVASQGSLKQFLVTAASLWMAAVIGSWCNFLTVLYIGFVAAHTLPVLYEKNKYQVDSFLDNLIGQFQHHYKKIDFSVLSRMPTRSFRTKKHE